MILKACQVMKLLGLYKTVDIFIPFSLEAWEWAKTPQMFTPPNTILENLGAAIYVRRPKCLISTFLHCKLSTLLCLYNNSSLVDLNNKPLYSIFSVLSNSFLSTPFQTRAKCKKFILQFITDSNTICIQY